jgi:hypothetical protein
MGAGPFPWVEGEMQDGRGCECAARTTAWQDNRIWEADLPSGWKASSLLCFLLANPFLDVATGGGQVLGRVLPSHNLAKSRWRQPSTESSRAGCRFVREGSGCRERGRRLNGESQQNLQKLYLAEFRHDKGALGSRSAVVCIVLQGHLELFEPGELLHALKLLPAALTLAGRVVVHPNSGKQNRRNQPRTEARQTDFFQTWAVSAFQIPAQTSVTLRWSGKGRDGDCVRRRFGIPQRRVV